MAHRDVQVRFQLTPESRKALKEVQRQIDGLAKAFRDFSVSFTAAFEQAVEQFKRGFKVVQESQKQHLRRIHGEGDHRGWQSYMCSAWLHDSCPHPVLTRCMCKCHGDYFK